MKKIKCKNLLDRCDIKIGYIGNHSINDVKKLLTNHILFENKNLIICKKEFPSELKDELCNKTLDFIIVPCRDSENKVNATMIDFISSMVSRGYIEIGAFYCNNKYDEKKQIIQSKDIIDKNPTATFDKSIYTFSKNGKYSQVFDYKIFKLSDYKTPFWTKKVPISLFANGYVVKTSIILLSFSTIVCIVIGIITYINGLENAGLWISLVAAVIPFISSLFNLQRKSQLSLITGYWIYYSFEEATSSSSFVPKGFKTRLIKISSKNEQLNFLCNFEGEDNIFFSTDEVSFDYDTKGKIAKGFYEYVTNTRNNKYA